MEYHEDTPTFEQELKMHHSCDNCYVSPHSPGSNDTEEDQFKRPRDVNEPKEARDLVNREDKSFPHPKKRRFLRLIKSQR